MHSQDQVNDILDLVNEDELVREYTLKYHEIMDKSQRDQTLLKTAMEAFDTLREAFDTLLSKDDYKIIAHDVLGLKEDLLGMVQDCFENAEEQAVQTLEGTDPEAFKALDEYKADMLEDLLLKNPKELYELGVTLISQDDSYLTLSEEDVILELGKQFDREYVIGQLAQKFAHIIDNHTKYVLEVDEEEAELEGVQEINQSDSILVSIGQYDIEDYFDIYPFLYEYTGERISYIGNDEESGEISYWGTYEEYFQNILRDMVLTNLARVLEKLNQTRHSEYTMLMEYLKVPSKEFNDTQKILNQSPVLYRELYEFEENIWSKFVESEAATLYNLGKKGS